MKLIDLIIKSNFDEVWLELEKAYCLSEEARDDYKDVIDELIELPTVNKIDSGETFTIGVCELEDVIEAGTFVFDVFGISHNDGNRYSLVLDPWSYWLACDVLDKSIEMYGEVVVFAHIIYEMTFHGYSSHDAEQNQQEIIESLDEANKEIEEGRSAFISSEEVFAALGLDRDKAKEPVLEKKRKEATKAAIARNELRLKELMSDWRRCR
jgi:predicted RNase H-like HicB family nuclease